MAHAIPRQTRTDAARTVQTNAPMRSTVRTRTTAPAQTTRGQRTRVVDNVVIDEQPTRRARTPTTQQQRTVNAPLTPAETIQGVDRLTGLTPNYEIERLLMAIDRFRRERTPVPKNAGYRGNWEWVQFEVTRRLKRAIRERDEALIAIGNAITMEIKQLNRPQAAPARKPKAQESQAQTTRTRRVQALRAA
jgi:hypothetical protein